ncbi:MAG: DUF4080 domain-containing protein [Verrucomicrobiota bacterium]
MAEIVLSTLNAKYIHTAFGLRYLMANLGDLASRTALVEFDLNRRPLELAEALLKHEPRILGLGVYIWNVTQTTELVAILKRLRPDLCIILGGPEVSYEYNTQPIVALADYVITGEADLKFAEVCRRLLAGDRPPAKIILAELPEFHRLKLPYAFYTPEDLAHRLTYVEASRGCPFSCEFCLSSLDIPVRQAPLPDILAALADLLDRGSTQLKFVDRTFNLDLKFSRAILEFLLTRYQPGHLYHFELVPDRLPDELREIIVRFPPGALQFEVGIQTFNPEAATLIQRRQNYDRLAENLRFLRQHTGVHIHADLIFGLPGEDAASFATGFDRLLAFQPQEIQVGILKRLRGTSLGRHDAEWGMVYNPNPPYDILQNRLIPFAEMQRLRRFARYWDLVANSGNFARTAPLIWESTPSAFASFMQLSDWLHQTVGRTDAISLPRLMELLHQYLVRERGLTAIAVAESLLRDYQAPGRREIPGFLQAHLPATQSHPPVPQTSTRKRRQDRHLTGETSSMKEMEAER